MAVSYLCGFGLGTLSEADHAASVPNLSIVNNPLGSGMCLRVAATNSSQYLQFSKRLAGGTFSPAFYSYRVYVRLVTISATEVTTLATLIDRNGTGGWTVGVNPSRQIVVFQPVTGTTITATSVLTWPNDTNWHLLEVSHDGNNSKVYLDGVELFTYAGATAAYSTLQLGTRWYSSGTTDVYYSSLVAYDSVLPADRPSEYSVTLLRPMSDASVGNWRRNDGTTTTGLYTAVDNVPPTGTAATATLATNYVQNGVAGTSSAADNLDFECAPYGSVVSVKSGQLFPANIYIGGAAGVPAGTRVAAGHLFAAPTTAPVSHFVAYLSKVGNPTDNLRITLQPNSASFNTATPMASVSIPASQISTTSTRHIITFPSPATVTQGQSYIMAVSRTGPGDSSNYYIAEQADSIGNESGLVTWDGTAWMNYGTQDFRGEVYFDVGNTVYAIMPIINDAQQVTTGSPKSGAIAVAPIGTTPVINLNTGADAGGAWGGGANAAYAQSFIAPGPIESVTDHWNNTTWPVGQYGIEIQTDSNNLPSGTKIGTTGTLVSSGTPVVVDAMCTPGVKYWAVIKRIVNAAPFTPANVYFTYDTYPNLGSTNWQPSQGAWSVPSTSNLLVTILPFVSTDQTFDFGLPNGSAGSTSATAQGAFPVGWGTHAGSVLETADMDLSPSSSPTVRIKRTGTYTRVVSVDAAGVYALTGPAPPNAPTNLTATGDVDSILVDWDAPATGTTPTSYKVRRWANELIGNDANFTDSVGGWTKISGNGTLSAVNGTLRVTNTDGTTTHVRSPRIPFVADGWFLFRARLTELGAWGMFISVNFYNSSNVLMYGDNTMLPVNNDWSWTSREVPYFSSAAFVDITLYPAGAVGEYLEVDTAFLSASAPSVTTVTAPTTQYDDTTALPDTTYIYYVNTVAAGMESVSSNTATGSLSTIVVPSMIEMVGIPI